MKAIIAGCIKHVSQRHTIADRIVEPGYDDEFKLPIQFHVNDESRAWKRFHFPDNGEVTYMDIRHYRLRDHSFDNIQ